MSEEKKWYCSDCGGQLWPTCYYCNEPMTTEDAQEIKAHLEQCEKRPPPEIKQLVEWLEDTRVLAENKAAMTHFRGMMAANRVAEKLMAKELADATMTIGVLKATIETREEMEEKLMARVAVMAEAIEAVGLCRGGPPGGLQWMECRWCGRISVGSVTKHYEGCQRQKALSAAPKVVWSGKAIRTGVGNGWTSIMVEKRDIWAVPVELDTKRFRVYVLADDKPQEGEE